MLLWTVCRLKKKVVNWTEEVRGTSPLTHTEFSLNRGQTGMWRCFVQQSQSCHFHPISSSYSSLPIQREKKSPPLPSFSSSLSCLEFCTFPQISPFFHQPHFSCLNSPSLQNFLFFLSLAPAARRLSLSFTPSQYCPTSSVIYEPQEAFVPLKAVMSCFSIQRWKKYPDVLFKIVKVLKLKYILLSVILMFSFVGFFSKVSLSIIKCTE